MVGQTLYLDGCSFTAGQNLAPEHNLESLFRKNTKFSVINRSRPGKSNLAIAMDVYDHLHCADTFVIGWTFADRFYMQYEDIDVDLLPQFDWLPKLNHKHAGMIEQDYKNFHRYFYSLYHEEYMNKLSDMLVTSTYQLLRSHDKKVVFFSWEKRRIDQKILYPYVSPQHKLPCGHLNQQGTLYLWQNIQSLLDDYKI